MATIELKDFLLLIIMIILAMCVFRLNLQFPYSYNTQQGWQTSKLEWLRS